MRRAIEVAVATRPHPNPRVGAVVLDKSGHVVAEASHEGPGHSHAEALALRQAGRRAAKGTLVVTLEPCRHLGRTPPCTEAIIESEVARVVYGAADPDERVAGRGAADLAAAGIEVTGGVLQDEVEELDPAYFHHRRTGFPLVTLKVAATLDGQSAALDGASQWITSEEARRDGHLLRSSVDAVMVGAGTLLADDPRLTVRLDGYAAPQPLPVLIAGSRAIPTDAALFAGKALVYAPEALELPAEVVVLAGAAGVDLPAALADLGQRGVLSVLVEGGPLLASALLGLGLVDRGVWYAAARLAGGTGQPALAGAWTTLADAVSVHLTTVEPVGPDLRIEFVPEGA